MTVGDMTVLVPTMLEDRQVPMALSDVVKATTELLLSGVVISMQAITYEEIVDALLIRPETEHGRRYLYKGDPRWDGTGCEMQWEHYEPFVHGWDHSQLWCRIRWAGTQDGPGVYEDDPDNIPGWVYRRAINMSKEHR